MNAKEKAARRLIRTLKSENVFLQASLLEKEKAEEEAQTLMDDLKNKLTKTEEELEVTKYNNVRLTKRVEQLMAQLRNPAEATSMLGWLAPRSMLGALFGSSEDANRLHQEVESLQEHVANLIRTQANLQERYNVETQTLNTTINNLRKQFAAQTKELEQRTLQSARRRLKLSKQKKRLQEAAERIVQLEQTVTDLTRDKVQWQEADKKVQEQLAVFGAQLKGWREIEEMGLTPTKVRDLAANKDTNDLLVFQETGSLEEDICKLQAILIVKLKEFRVFGANTTQPPDSKDVLQHSCSDNEDETEGALRGRIMSEDYGYSADMKDIETMLRSVECPYKLQLQASEEVLRETKKKTAILEKKEKLLERIINSALICPTCTSSINLPKILKLNCAPH